MATKILTTLTLVFTLGTSATFAQSAATTSKPDTTLQKVFRFVDQQAEPKGGTEAFLRYLTKHVSYPKTARDSNIQGRVMLQFIVNEDGKLSDIKIVKDIGGNCGEVVKKAIEKYPYLWTPAKTNGKPVKSFYTVPFTFSLQ